MARYSRRIFLFFTNYMITYKDVAMSNRKFNVFTFIFIMLITFAVAKLLDTKNLK